MFALQLITRTLRRINDVIARIATAISMAVIAFATLALFTQAVERHVTGQGYAWMSDFPPFLMPWCVFPMMGVLLRGDNHIVVEVAPNMLHGKALAVLRLFIALVCVVSGAYFCQQGAAAVEFFAMLGEVTETEIRIPFWWLYLAFPTGFAVLVLFGLERALEELLALLGKPRLEPAT